MGGRSVGDPKKSPRSQKTFDDEFSDKSATKETNNRVQLSDLVCYDAALLKSDGVRTAANIMFPYNILQYIYILKQ